jgi:hypothetical protein
MPMKPFCPTCAPPSGCLTKPPGKCVLYSGVYLPVLNVLAGQNLDDILGKIDDLIGSSGSGLTEVSHSNTASITISGLGTVSSPLSATYIGATPNLQQVTNVGASTTNPIIVTGASPFFLASGSAGGALAISTTGASATGGAFINTFGNGTASATFNLQTNVGSGTGRIYFDLTAPEVIFNSSTPLNISHGGTIKNTFALDGTLSGTDAGAPDQFVTLSQLQASVSNLQQVTTAGNTTTNDMTIDNPSGGSQFMVHGGFGAFIVARNYTTNNSIELNVRDNGESLLSISATSPDGTTGIANAMIGRYTDLKFVDASETATNILYSDGRMSGTDAINADDFVTLGQLSGLGGGTVTSVGLSLPSIFGLTGSPVTTTGTFTATLNTQVMNTIFSGPAAGADAIPTFRALVAADIPDIAGEKIVSGTVAGARLGSGSNNYIQNQTASPQAASFRIANNGAIGNQLSVAYSSSLTYSLTVGALASAGGIAAEFVGRCIGVSAVNSNEYTTLGQVTTLISGVGTVSSVALTAPSVFSVAGSPVTTTGTLALTFATGQTANQILASPNGSTGAVGLRALVAADIPSLPFTQITGTVPVLQGGTALTSVGSNGTFLSSNGTILSYRVLASTDIPALDAAKITTGTFGTALLGSGTANSTVFLRGDSTFTNTLAGPFNATGRITSTITTEQLRAAYDASNYMNFVVASNGSTTIDLTGTSPLFSFGKGASFTAGIAANNVGFNLSVVSINGGTSTTTATYLFAGATTVNYRVGIRGSGANTLAAASSGANFIVANNAITTASSGTHALVANAVITAPTITSGGASTVTNSASLYIDAAPTGATNNYSFLIAAGDSKVAGNSITGGQRVGYTTWSTATQTATTSMYFLEYTGSISSTLTLPSAATNIGQMYFFENNGSGTVTVSPGVWNQTGGGTTITSYGPASSFFVISNGTNWVRIV